MRKLRSWKEMRVDEVYNLVYVGEDKRRAVIGGKRTVLIQSISPLRYVILHSQFGNPFTLDLRNDQLDWNDYNPTADFTEVEIYQPDSEEEWFKHSMRVNSLQEGFDLGVITLGDIQGKTNHRQFDPYFSGSEFMGVHLTIWVKSEIPKYPLLKVIFLYWKGWKEMQLDFQRYGITVRT